MNQVEPPNARHEEIHALIVRCRENEDFFLNYTLFSDIILALEGYLAALEREPVKNALALACQGEHR